MLLRSFSFLGLIVLLVSCQPRASEVTLSALFTDNMVLQRGQEVPVWGKATPGGVVMVSINDIVETAGAAEDSTWEVRLPAMEAGGPYTLSVWGTEEQVLENVMVGEVWVASGQSNMEWSVQNANDARAEIAAADYPDIRLYTVPRTVSLAPLDDIATDGWQPVTPETIADFSAVAYYFGRKLHDELGVAIGLINTTWGGTRAEAWTSRAGLAELDDFSEQVEAMPTSSFKDIAEAFEEQRLVWEEELREVDPGHQATWQAADFGPQGWPSMTIPTYWDEGDGPLTDYDGVVWFRRTFVVPDALANLDLTLYLGAIDDQDVTWVNGIEVGAMQQYNAPRVYIIPDSVVQAGQNTITIRVLDTGGRGGFNGSPEDLRVESPVGNPPISLAGSWQYNASLELRDLPPGRPAAPARQHIPTVLYNAMVAPLIPYGMRGVIWYQGESNAGRAYQYRDLFPAMITDWRTQWGQEEFPFLFVQLANFMQPQTDPNEQSAWAELREAQTMTLDVPNTAMATIIDIGEADDIHPRNKQDVGLRLSLGALYVAYGQDIVYAGPLATGQERVNNALAISFNHVGSGLVARGETLKGFAIAGEDRQFVWAEARIEGERVFVSSPLVPEPVAVRYAWANNPDATLYNTEGLPATPFRTDNWPGVTMGVK